MWYLSCVQNLLNPTVFLLHLLFGNTLTWNLKLSWKKKKPIIISYRSRYSPVDCTCEVRLGAAGFVARAAEGSRGAGVTVLRLRAATSETPHLTVRPIHHLDELSHPGDGGREGENTRGRKPFKPHVSVSIKPKSAVPPATLWGSAAFRWSDKFEIIKKTFTLILGRTWAWRAGLGSSPGGWDRAAGWSRWPRPFYLTTPASGFLPTNSEHVYRCFLHMDLVCMLCLVTVILR